MKRTVTVTARHHDAPSPLWRARRRGAPALGFHHDTGANGLPTLRNSDKGGRVVTSPTVGVIGLMTLWLSMDRE